MAESEVAEARSVVAGSSPETAVQSVRRAAQVLGCFTAEHPELGVTELSRELGLHKSTVSRLLTALRDEGLVVQETRTGKYQLGAKVLSMAAVVLSSLDLSEITEPEMRRLVAETGETVSLVVQQGGLCFDLHSVPSRHPIRAERPPAQAEPLWASAAGRIWQAFGVAGDGLREALAAPGEGSVPDGEAQARTLRDIRSVGYAIVRGEWAPDLVEIAAPVWDYRGRLRAALCVSGPAYRLTPETTDTVVTALLRVSASISRHLGFEP